ncbi:MAG: T9SS type A sorting domain-containing protein [Ignavibacteriales bacterium]|nr:MAG: T9SS type A sorting domain-containing protein [Ignavibacteriales bacterium]
MNKFVLFLLFLFSAALVTAQEIGDYRSNPSGFGGTGDWNNVADWQQWDGGGWIDAEDYPNNTTASVTIQSNHSVNLNTNASVYNLTIENDGGLRNSGSTLFGIYMNGDLDCDGTIGSPTDRIALSLSSSSVQSSTGNGTVYLEFIAKLQNTSSTYNHGVDMKLYRTSNVVYCTSNTLTFNMGTGLLEIVNSASIGGSNVSFNFNGGTVKYSYTGNQTVSAGTYNNLTLAGSGNKTLNGNITVNGTLSLQGAALLNVSSSSVTYGGSSTLEYAGSSAQVTSSNEFSSVVNLSVNNPAGVYLNSAKSISGTISVFSGSTLFNEGHNFLTGSFVNNGSVLGSGYFTLTGNSGMISGTGLVEYLEINSPGTINNSSSLLTISKGLKLTAGTFTNSGSINFNNNAVIIKNTCAWSTAGTINYAGTIDLNYTGACTTSSELPLSAISLNNLTVNAAVSLAANVVVNGILTLNDALTVGNRTLTLKNPVAGTPDNLIASSGAGSRITIAGTASGITIPQSVESLHTLILNNVNGTLLQDNLTVENTLTCSNGFLKTNGFVLTWNGSSLTESAGSYVQGILQTSASVGTGSSSFKGIGLILSSGSNDLGNVTVKRYSGPGTGVNVGINTGINRKWEITPSNNYSTLDRTLTLSWVSTDDNGKTLNAMRVWQFNTLIWKDISGSSQDAVTRTINTSLPDVINSGYTFIYTVTDEFSPLPVELTSFYANTSKNSVKLLWETATEVQNFGFEVERKSEANSEWKNIGFVAGNGNSNTVNKYSFTDNEIVSGKYSYRLKQLDNDGGYSYSDVVNVELGNLPTEFSLGQNYPNPFNPSTTFTFDLPVESQTTLSVYNLLGEKVATLIDGMMKAGTHQIKFDGSKLSSGIYIYSLEAGDKKFTKKMILTK